MKKSIPTFDIRLKKSRLLCGLFFIVFILALISCWLNAFQLLTQSLLALTVIIFMARALRSGVTDYCGVKGIHCKHDGSFKLIGGNIDDSCAYRLQPSSTVFAGFFFLHFQSKTNQKNLVLASDSLSSEAARKLRVALTVYKAELLAVKA